MESQDHAKDEKKNQHSEEQGNDKNNKQNTLSKSRKCAKKQKQSFSVNNIESNLENGVITSSSDLEKDCQCEVCAIHSFGMEQKHTSGSQIRPSQDQNQNLNLVGIVLDDPVDEAFSEDLNGSSSRSSNSQSSPIENGSCYNYGEEDIDFTKLQDVSQDDMERYFRENVHMLQRHSSSDENTPAISPRNDSLNLPSNNPLVNSVNGWHAGNVTCTYPSSGHGIVTDTGYSNINGATRIPVSDSDSDEGGVYVLPEDLVACQQTKKKYHQSDDDGDFIESDIPRNRYSGSLDSSTSITNSLSRNSVSSSYEDLQTSNIQRPSSGDSNSGKAEDDETFTKLVFEKDNKDEDTDDYVHPWTRSRNDSESDSYSLPVPRPTNLFDSHLHCCGNKRRNLEEGPNIATCTSNSTSSSSPYTVSSAFISPQYSDNSNLYNGITSESSVFMSPDTSDSGTGSVGQRRQSFLRHQSMDYNVENGADGGLLRSARSSGDLPNRNMRDGSLLHGTTANEHVPLIPKSHSHNIRHLCQRGQPLSSSSSPKTATSPLKKTGSKESNISNGGLNKLNNIGVPDAAAVNKETNNVSCSAMQSIDFLEMEQQRRRDTSSVELLPSEGSSSSVIRMLSCAFCKRQRQSTQSSCDNNTCDVTHRVSLSAPPTPPLKARGLHNCTCSVSYYFSCRRHGRLGINGRGGLMGNASSSSNSSRNGEDGINTSHVYNNGNFRTESSFSDHGDLLSNRAGDTTPVVCRRMRTNNLSSSISLFSPKKSTNNITVSSNNTSYSQPPKLSVTTTNGDSCSSLSRQTSTSNCDYEENNIRAVRAPSLSTSTHAITVQPVNRFRNRTDAIPSVSMVAPPRMRPYINRDINSGECGLQESQENENNTNIENGQLLQQAANIALNSHCNRRDLNNSVTSQWNSTHRQAEIQRDRELVAEGKDRTAGATSGPGAGNMLGVTGGDNVSMRGRRKGIKILPLLLRSANTIDEMDPQAVMELFMQNDEDSEDDGYVDFHKMLRDYMEQKLYEKHSVASTWYSCEEERDLGGISLTMIWTEYQAYLYHTRQIGKSACGATAIINVLKVFEVYPDEERVCDAIKTNQRSEKSSLPEYLLSRSVAGTTADYLIMGVNKLSHGGVYGKFFHFHPDREVCVRQWLSHWIKKGAVPVVTLNLQKAVPSGHLIPDAWHHQMVFGVGPQGVYLTNPQEIVPECVIKQQLCSRSVLLVKRKDILSRWSDDCDLSVLMRQKDPRWRTMNVLGQVVNVLREERTPHFPGFRPQLTSHISIPAWYKSGITLFIRKSNSAYKELRTLAELTVRPPKDKGRKK